MTTIMLVLKNTCKGHKMVGSLPGHELSFQLIPPHEHYTMTTMTTTKTTITTTKTTITTTMTTIIPASVMRW